MSSTYLINDIPRGVSPEGLILFLGALVNGSVITDSHLDQLIRDEVDSSPYRDLIGDFEALVYSAYIMNSRLDDELSVATIQFHDTPKWLKARDHDPCGFPITTKLGTIWRGVDMTREDGYGRTAFIRAVMNGNLKLAETLAEYEDTDVNIKDKEGMTALHWACKEGLTDLTSFCLSVPGIDISIRSNAGLTAFDIAYSEALRDDNDAIPTLFYKSIFEMDEYDPDNALLQLLTLTANPGGRTAFPQEALLNPARNGNLALVQALIQNITFTGPITTNGDKDTALHLAARGGHAAVVNLFLDNELFNVNATSRHGYTALHYAAQQGHTQTVDLLVQRGADMEAVERHGRTALHLAAEHGFELTVRLLLGRGANLESRDKDGKTPLYMAVMTGLEICETTVQLLVSCGANIGAVDNQGQTPLRLAEGNKYQNILQLLRGLGLKHNEVQPILNSHSPWKLPGPLEPSVQKEGQIRMAKLLQECGGDINGKDDEGRTALHMAAYQQDLVVVRLLLDQGANIEEKFWTWRTELEIALKIAKDNKEIVKLLLEWGAKTTPIDKNLQEWVPQRRPQCIASGVKDNGVVPQLPYWEANGGADQGVKADLVEISVNRPRGTDQEPNYEAQSGLGVKTKLLSEQRDRKELKLDLIPQGVVGAGLIADLEVNKEAEDIRGRELEDDNYTLASPSPRSSMPDHRRYQESSMLYQGYLEDNYTAGSVLSRSSTPGYREYQESSVFDQDFAGNESYTEGSEWLSSRSSTPVHRGYQDAEEIYGYL